MRLAADLDRYLTVFEPFQRRLDPLKALFAEAPDPISRQTMPGHVTGSGIVTDGERLLVIHHVRLDRWLQPGGHLDPGETPLQAALRETLEETGARAAAAPWHLRTGLPVDIDAHVIPASQKRGEAEHIHFDYRFVLRADPAAEAVVNEAEVSAMRWVTASEAKGLALPADLWRALHRAAELGLLAPGWRYRP